MVYLVSLLHLSYPNETFQSMKNKRKTGPAGTRGRPSIPNGKAAQSVSFSFPEHGGHKGLSGQLLQDLRRWRYQQRSVRLADAFHHEHPVRILAGKHQHDPDLFANRGEGGKSLIVTDQMPNCIFTHPGCIRLKFFV